jgi:hypothetical protein
MLILKLASSGRVVDEAERRASRECDLPQAQRRTHGPSLLPGASSLHTHMEPRRTLKHLSCAVELGRTVKPLSVNLPRCVQASALLCLDSRPPCFNALLFSRDSLNVGSAAVEEYWEQLTKSVPSTPVHTSPLPYPHPATPASPLLLSTAPRESVAAMPQSLGTWLCFPPIAPFPLPNLYQLQLTATAYIHAS